MRQHFIPPLLLVAITIGFCQGLENTFTAVSPKLIRENSKYIVQIAVEEKSESPITFTVSVNSSSTDEIEGVLYTAETIEIKPGESADVEVPVKVLPVTVYNLTVTGTQGESTFTESANIFKDTKTQSLLLQTDKVIYKPGETVKFRVVMICTRLRPLDNQIVNVTVTDPQRNIIKLLNNERVEKGIFSSKFELSTEPNLGDWKIRAESNGQVEYHTFSVDQYVLPKFKVEVKLPPFVTYNSSKFQAEIRSAYTYEKPLKGQVEVRLSEYSRYYWGGPPKTVLKTSQIDGSAFFEFNIAEELGQEPLTYDKTFTVLATVTDALTGRKQNGTSTIKVHQYPYKVEMVETPRNYKPGFPITLKFKVSTQDNVPISDENPQALKIEHGFSCNAEEGVLYSSIPAIGIVNITFDTPTNELISANALKVTYKDLTFNAYPPQKATTPSKAYMQLGVNTQTPAPNSSVQVKVDMNTPFQSLHYVLFGRGKLLQKKRVPMQAATKEGSFDVFIPASAAPEANLIVYTVLPSTEVVAESVNLLINTVFDNQLSIGLSKDKGQPGENIVISMDTAEDSLIAIRGVDQSVLLLKEDKDITVKTIEGEIKSFQNQVSNHRHWGGSSAYQVFEETGVVIITNGKLDKPPKIQILHSMPLAYAEASYAPNALAALPGPPGAAGSPVRKKGASQVSAPRVRTKFPETWLWEEIQANESFSKIERVIPDTLTSWFVSGYALSPSKGIGVVPSPKVLETFRPFFISLNLPYSVVRGEVFGLQVLVHNYMANEVTTEVTLDNKQNSFDYQEKSEKSIQVGPNEVKSVTFVIKPTKFGQMSLDVKAVTTSAGPEQAGDALSRTLLVKPPGKKMTLNRAVLVDLRKTATAQGNLSVEFPPTRVDGADSVKMTVIADMLGSTISNLDKLLKMPCGCGEQNMVYFVPDIVILQYLEASGTLTPQIKSKAVKFLESGYQRQLTYRHNDGSFSAFGKHDAHGSTWLTAFVVRSFIAARPYITIDETVITDALRFLEQKQQADGSFVEHGTVFQQELKGGAVESLSLSAYVTLAFVESSDSLYANVSQVRQKGLEFISKAPTDLDSPYAASLITYTLKKANHEKAGVFKQILEGLVKTEGDLKYWEPKKVEIPANETCRPWTPRIKPVSVEMTSYALLSYLHEGDLEKALPVGKWLLQQRNSHGGFISTQDTVVGLTALAKFAMTTKSTESDLTIKAKHAGGTEEFKVTKENEVVLQETILPANVRAVDIEAEGKGTALVQLTGSYYVEDNAEEPAFSLEIKSESKESKLDLNVCTSYTHIKGKTSNMAVMEVNLPSGFVFDSDGLLEIKTVENVKRYDLEEGDTQLSVYFDHLSSAKTCLDLPANRVFKVANPAKPHVVVYDYYDTTLRAREFYDSPEYSACDICVGDDSCAIQNCV